MMALADAVGEMFDNELPAPTVSAAPNSTSANRNAAACCTNTTVNDDTSTRTQLDSTV